MTTFVLVHGAWHGGWCWERVARPLRTAGHRVFTPTLTGLAERADLLTPEVGLRTHVEDITALLRSADLTEVVLVGHSYSGFVVREAADRVRERVAALVLLDAWVGNDGQSLLSRAPDWFAEATRDTASRLGDGWRIPVPPAHLVGVTDPRDVSWLEANLTEHPLLSFQEATVLTGAVETIPCHAVVTRPGGIPFTRWAHEFGWAITELDSGHDMMVTAPDALATILSGLAQRQDTLDHSQ